MTVVGLTVNAILSTQPFGGKLERTMKWGSYEFAVCLPVWKSDSLIGACVSVCVRGLCVPGAATKAEGLDVSRRYVQPRDGD